LQVNGALGCRRVLELPFLTSARAPIAFAYKRAPEDFEVEELPAYAPSGSGEHLYLWIEKRGIGTREAIAALAEHFGRGVGDFGSAGLKDAQAVTRQWISALGVAPERARGLELRGLRVLEARLHGNKLRIGHLRGNRFKLKLRGLDPERVPELRAGLDELAQRGLPNAFGEQRFGLRGDGAQIGRALLARDWEELVARICGRPGPRDAGPILRAREHYEAGDYARAARAWPGHLREPIRMLRALQRGASAHVAARALERGSARLYVSAWQSELFNRVLAARMPELGQLQAGDLAWRHQGGAVFAVEDVQREQPRADAFEISPSGPLFGERMTRPLGAPAELEERVLAEAGARRADFERGGVHQPAGGRRPLRVPLGPCALETGRDAAGSYAQLEFELPAGSFATQVLRELGKGAETQGG